MTGIDRRVDVGSRLFLLVPEKHSNIVRNCLSVDFHRKMWSMVDRNKKTVRLIVGLAIGNRKTLFEIHIDILYLTYSFAS